MKTSELISRLKGYLLTHGDEEVEVFHAGFEHMSNIITAVTIPQDRRIVQIVTVPFDWTIQGHALKESDGKQSDVHSVQ